ncbi:uncharacterized protein MELLADRAFT_67414 [Melampsora larici-populina 98AG31]|uniref:DUF7872 domain-containing protein n=1 Tax=Melampsora larici-populina (strain 98AG31 / pathotype 3-4-7) TaxID=747676 RepID=F4S323_MELLP|nr:uncharacterized protein MELLADRAFT_67414 [Melampsora larici-populina 98AG31]EGG00903.1 hypothetical protein MELLADRAFT_67414 [Melampsora larici-populina 98AG31]
MVSNLLLISTFAGGLVHGHMEKRDVPPPNVGNNTNTTSPLPVTTIETNYTPPAFQIPPPTVNWSDPCAIVPIQPDTWARLKLDDYLANYPGGRNMSLAVSVSSSYVKVEKSNLSNVNIHDYYDLIFPTVFLQEFASSRGVDNFVCGIGETCNAGQPCFPIKGPDWEVFYALQGWNLIRNTLYGAIGTAVSITQSAGIAALIASVAIAWPGTLLAMGIWYSINALLGIGQGAIGMTLLGENWKEIPDQFSRWSQYAWYLGKWQGLAQEALSNQTTAVLNAGISTPEGISGVLKGGAYFIPVKARQMSEVENEISTSATARILTQIIRDYGGFVTVSEGCDGKGPNGAWEDPDSISYCYPNKTMMNVIRHKGKKAVNTWYHGSLINSTYGFTAEYITTQAWECQQMHGVGGPNPYNDTAFPTNSNSTCVMDLPVCDLRSHMESLSQENNVMF